MKKIAKLSLVAAVAVAGLTTANAQLLEQAIKDVEVSGSVVYRYNDYNNDTANSGSAYTTTAGAKNQTNSKSANGDKDGTQSDSDNNYKVGLNLASKVNDFVKFNSRFLVADAKGEWAAGGLDNQGGGDANPEVTLSNAYFGFTGFKNTTINAGKQGLTTPWTVATQIDGNEQTGTGLLALHTLNESVTFAAAYFNQTNLDKSGNLAPISAVDGSEDIATVGTIVAAGPVTLDAWYADMQEVFSTYTLGAKTSVDVGGVTLGADARYTALQLDRNFAENSAKDINGNGFASSYDSIHTTYNESNVHDDNSLAKLTLTAKAGIFGGKASYGKTGKEGGLTALDNDASTTFLAWGVTPNGKADADFYHLQAGVDILPELNFALNYAVVDYTVSDTVEKNAKGDVINSTVNSAEEEEFYGQLTYKMSKNLVSYVRYGVFTKDSSTHDQNDENVKHGDSRSDAIDDTRGRIQVAYTF